MTSAGVGPLCFIKSKVNAAVYQEILEHFMLPSADKLYGDADFLFQQDLAPAHTVKGTKSWFNDHGVTMLDWPANSPDLNPIWNLWDIFKRKMRNSRSNNTDETEGSIVPQQCHTLIASMPHLTRVCAKGSRPSIECINEHNLKNLNISVLQILFLIDLRKYSNILRY